MSSYSSDVRTWSWYIALFNVDMGGKKITNLATPTTGADAATKDYVDTLTTNTWSTFPAISNVAMAGFKITNLGAPTVGSDATTKTYVNDQDLLWATHAATSNVTMGAYKFDRVDVTGDITNNANFVTQGAFAQIGGDVNFVGGTSKTLISTIKIDSNLGTTYIRQDPDKIQFSTGSGDNNCNMLMTAATGVFQLNAQQTLYLASDDSDTPSATLSLTSLNGDLSGFAYGTVYIQGGNGASLLNMYAAGAQFRNTTQVEIVADQGTGDFSNLMLKTNTTSPATARLFAPGEVELVSDDGTDYASLKLNANGASAATAILDSKLTTVKSTGGDTTIESASGGKVVINATHGIQSNEIFTYKGVTPALDQVSWDKLIGYGTSYTWFYGVGLLSLLCTNGDSGLYLFWWKNGQIPAILTIKGCDDVTVQVVSTAGQERIEVQETTGAPPDPAVDWSVVWLQIS